MSNIRRSLSQSFVELREFDELSDKAKLLYVYLNLEADDFGFITTVRKVMSSVDATQTHLEELYNNGLIMTDNVSKVSVLIHWRLNNVIRTDRCNTKYENLLRCLGYNESTGAYFIKNSEDSSSIIKKYPQRKKYIYLIQNDGHTKIGYTSKLQQRLSALKISAPLAFIYAVKETETPREDESYYHRMFAEKRFQREWFNLSQEDLDFLLTDGFVRYTA